MSKDNNFDQISSKVIDMLVDSTLKKHNVKLEAEKIDDQTKEELRDLVKDLQKSVQSLKQTKDHEDD